MQRAIASFALDADKSDRATACVHEKSCRLEELAERIARHPSAILLVVQLLGVLVYPFMEQGGIGALLFEVFGALVLALAIWATRESPGQPGSR